MINSNVEMEHAYQLAKDVMEELIVPILLMKQIVRKQIVTDTNLNAITVRVYHFNGNG